MTIHANQTQPKRVYLITYCILSQISLIEAINVSCRTPEEVLAAKGVKPTLSPNLNTLALVEVLSIT